MSDERPTEIQRITKAVKEIVSIAETVPEPYRQKCFEILLIDYLRGNNSTGAQQATATVSSNLKGQDLQRPFTMPIDVRAFFTQQNIPEEIVEKLFFIEGNEIRPIYKLKTTKKAKTQIQLALLVALENALKTGAFSFSQEEVRQRCIEHHSYDKNNFAGNFRNNKRLFKSLDESEHVEISPDGKAELAETILEITQ